MSYRVTLLESDLAFDVEPHETMLAAALRAEINLPHDCKSGTCGTCRFKLIEGSVEYAAPPMGLEPEEAEAGFALACQARPTSDIVAEAELMPSLLPDPLRCQSRVVAADRLAADVVHLKLALPEGIDLAFLPGQHINIWLPDGSTRSFSLASRPAGDGTIDLHVRQIPGGRFTQGHLATLKAGDALDVELPLGSFFLRDDFRPLIMVATGTGLAPIKSIIESLMDDPGAPPVALYWACAPKPIYISTARSNPGPTGWRISATCRCCPVPATTGRAGAAMCRTPSSGISRIWKSTRSIFAARPE